MLVSVLCFFLVIRLSFITHARLIERSVIERLFFLRVDEVSRTNFFLFFFHEVLKYIQAQINFFAV